MALADVTPGARRFPAAAGPVAADRPRGCHTSVAVTGTGTCAPGTPPAETCPRTPLRTGDLGRRVAAAGDARRLGGDRDGDGRGDVAVEDARDHVLGAQLLRLDDGGDRLRGRELHLLVDRRRP